MSELEIDKEPEKRKKENHVKKIEELINMEKIATLLKKKKTTIMVNNIQQKD